MHTATKRVQEPLILDMNRLPKNPELSNVETAVERFLAALFRCLADGMNPPGNQNYLVPLAAMYDGESRAVFKTLIAFAECGVRPTLAALRAVASEVGYRGIEKILNPYNSDLIDRLPLLESTGAGLHNFAAIVIQAHRRREQVRRLHHRLSRLQSETLRPVAICSGKAVLYCGILRKKHIGLHSFPHHLPSKLPHSPLTARNDWPRFRLLQISRPYRPDTRTPALRHACTTCRLAASQDRGRKRQSRATGMYGGASIPVR